MLLLAVCAVLSAVIGANVSLIILFRCLILVDFHFILVVFMKVIN